MNRMYRGLLFAWVTCLALLLMADNQALAQSTKEIQQKVFRVKFSENFARKLEKNAQKKSSEGYVLTGETELDKLSKQYGITSLKRVFRPAGKYEQKHRKWGLHLWYELKIEEGAKTRNAVAAFSKHAEVATAEPVYAKHRGLEAHSRKTAAFSAEDPLPGPANDPMLSGQWHFHNTGQDGGLSGADISLPAAWQQETGNSAVIVAVIDGGIDVNHTDLAPNMWINGAEIAGNGIDDDANGYIDDMYGYNFGDNNASIPADYHGTHVGGTVAAATNNSFGVAGVAGGSGLGDGARLMSLSAFGEVGIGGFDEAFIYAADNGAVISQNSWGYTSPGAYEQSVLDAINYFIAEAGYDAWGNPKGPMQGGIVIFAAGNSGTDEQWYPAYYEPVFAVAATDRFDNGAYFSNYGSWVELAAPGVDVYSTMPGNSFGPMSGTSMACPHASGVAALVVSKFAGNITPGQLRNQLISSTDKPASLPFGFGSGRLNAYAALQEQAPDSLAPETVTDLVVTLVQQSNVYLSWTAPFDASAGKATAYDLRFSTAPITEENFALAQQLPVPPPASAGSGENFTTTNLLPNTTYYFALKSADYTGNTSAMSNVVMATTQDAPVMVVSPGYLEVLIDASLSPVASSTLSLRNASSSAVLEFNIGMGWVPPGLNIHVEPAYGQLAAGDSLQLEVFLDASLLPNGYHYAELWISSNDPNSPAQGVPVAVNVVGQQPRLVINNRTLSFDSVPAGGSQSLPLVIRNEGLDFLHISGISTSDSAFTTKQGELFLNPSEQASVYVNFAPTQTGQYQARLSLHSNDPQQPLVEVLLEGMAVEPPVIEVNPLAFHAQLSPGQQAYDTLYITNTGKSQLNYGVSTTHLFRQGQNISNNTAALAATEAKPARGQADLRKSAMVQKNGGSDFGFGYTWQDNKEGKGPEFSWSDISGTGIDITDALQTGSFADGDVEVPVGFNFTYYGNTYSSVYISASGNLFFERQGEYAYTNERIPVPDYMNNVIAGFWDDLEPGVLGGSVHYQSTEKSLVVQYTGVTAYGYGGTAGITFQIILYANGNIKMQYLDVENAYFTANGTIGIEDASGTDGIEIAFNAPYVQNGLAISFESPAARTLAPGQTAQLPVVLDASQLLGGTYTDSILVWSNDPLNPVVNIPASLQVTGKPEINVMPDSIYFGQVYVMGDSASHYGAYQYAHVKNEGSADLYIHNISLQDSAAFSMDHASALVLSPQQEAYIPIYFAPKNTGIYQSALIFASNDATDSIISIPLYGEGVLPPVLEVSTPGDTLMARLRSYETAQGIISISNKGGSSLYYDAYVSYGSDSAAGPASLPAAIQPLARASKAKLQTVEASAASRMLQMAGNGAIFTDSIAYEYNNYPDFFFGTGEYKPISIATRFESPANGFSLTHVRNYSRTEGSLDPTYVAVFTGGDSPANASIVSWQEVTYGSSEGEFQLIALEEPLHFGAGQTFWVIFYYPATTFYPQGMSHGAEQKNTFWYSTDYGSAWYSFDEAFTGMIPKVRAMQGSNAGWISLDHRFGSVEAGQTGQMNVQMNASLLKGGDYSASIVFGSNDPVQPYASIPVRLHVNSKPQFMAHADSLVVKENEVLQFSLKATDADGGLLHYSLLESHANASFSSTADGAVISFRPDYSQSGIYYFTVVATDDMQEQAQTTLMVEVLDVNRLPVVMRQISKQSVKVNASLTLSLQGLFQDPDQDSLLLTATASNPTLVKLSLSSSGLHITGLAAGTTIVSLLASDGKGGVAGTSFEIRVTGGKKGGKNSREAEDNTVAENVLSFSALQNYPNPFSGETTIAYTLEEDGQVQLQVYTAAGVPVVKLLDKFQQKGVHSITFDAAKLPAGTYLYRLQIGEKVVTRRMIIQ